MQQEAYLLSLLISPHRKEMGETVFWSFFTGIGGDAQWVIQDCENHKLGDVDNIPTGPKHSRFAHVQLLFFYQCTLSHKLGASFCLFCFDFNFVRAPHYLLYMRMLLEIWVEISCILLLYWEKGCLSWFLMTHIVAWFMMSENRPRN